jgi:hypothetical protein
LPLRLKKKTSSTRDFLTAIRHQVFDWPTRILFTTRFTTASVYFRSFLKKEASVPTYLHKPRDIVPRFRNSKPRTLPFDSVPRFLHSKSRTLEKTRHRPATLFRDSGTVNQELCHLTLFRDFFTVNQELWKKTRHPAREPVTFKAGHFLVWYSFSLSQGTLQQRNSIPACLQQFGSLSWLSTVQQFGSLF